MFGTSPSVDCIYFGKNIGHRNYCNCSLQTRSLGSWISAISILDGEVYFKVVCMSAMLCVVCAPDATDYTVVATCQGCN